MFFMKKMPGTPPNFPPGFCAICTLPASEAPSSAGFRRTGRGAETGKARSDPLCPGPVRRGPVRLSPTKFGTKDSFIFGVSMLY